MQNKHLVVLSGAGISAESGLKTFRDEGGLWEGHNVYEVASIEGWNESPKIVLDFYNKRRTQLKGVKPNTAHTIISELENYFQVSVITQNVDDLHERAGSTNVLHLHGELKKACSEANLNLVKEVGYEDIHLGDKAEDGEQLRPAIVWFGEMVPLMEKAATIVNEADILVVLGTSLAVYPAAGLVNYAKKECLKFIIDPGLPELYNFEGWTHYQMVASEGAKKLKENLLG